MTVSNTFLLPEEYLVTITADENSSGYLYRFNSGADPSEYQEIAASSTTVIGPFSQPREYGIVSNLGLLTYELTSSSAGSTVLDDNTFATATSTEAASSLSTKTYVDNGDLKVLISHQDPSAAAEVDFIGLSSTYRYYEMIIDNLVLSSTSDKLMIQTSEDNGATYSTTAADYGWGIQTYIVGTGNFTTGTDAATGIILVGFNSSWIAGEVKIFNTNDAADNLCVVNNMLFVYTDTGGTTTSVGGGRRRATSNVNAIRLISQSGATLTGSVSLYGIK